MVLFWTLFFIFVVLEAVFRLPFLHPVSQNFEVVEYSGQFGWKLKPHIHSLWNNREWSVRYQTNSMGFRDDEHAVAKAPGVLRILILGDSYAEGWGVEKQAMW